MTPNLVSHSSSFEDMAEVYDSFTGRVEPLSRLESLSLDAILRRFDARCVLDCSCGTGIQTLGLAKRGYQMSASDVSPRMVSILRRKANSQGLRVDTKVADFRNLSPWAGKLFDAVICAGNSLSVLLNRPDALQALKAMRSKLRKPGGVVVLGLRNYGKLRAQKRRLVSRSPPDSRVQWFDIRAFGPKYLDVTYVRLEQARNGPIVETWAKRYSYLDPRSASPLVKFAGFPVVRTYEMKGLAPYDGGEWGFVSGSWKSPRGRK